MQILSVESFENQYDAEVIEKIQFAWQRCKGWERCKDGSFEMALANYGFYEACREADRRGLEWKHLIVEGKA